MTSSPEIPDEIVEKAMRAAEIHSIFYWQIRAALSAAAPSLRAQGMDKAITAMTDDDPDDILPPIMLQAVDAIRRARAAEIEGGKG